MPVEVPTTSATVATTAPAATVDAPASTDASASATPATPKASDATAPIATHATEQEPVSELEPFDFAQWDGKVDSLPEDIRVYGEGFSRFYQPKMSEMESKLSELKSASERADEFELLYNALTDGTEDPRVAQLTGETSKLKEAADAARAEAKAAKAALEELSKEIDATHERSALDRWTKFKAEYPILAKDQSSRETIASLLELGFELESVPGFMALPAKPASEVRALVESGTKPEIALELITLRTNPTTKTKPEDTSPAAAVAGAERPTGNPASMAQGTYRKEGYDARLERIIASKVR